MSNPFLDRLSRGPILGDGALGTMLHARGASLEQCLEELNLTRPDWVREIHLGYIRAGAEVIQTNTFAASRLRLADANLAEKARDINFRGVKLAREAREISGQAVWIAGSVGPLGRRRTAATACASELAADAFREQIAVLWEAGADLLIFETFSDLNELAVAVHVARETTDLPVVAEVTFGNDGITVSARPRPRWRMRWPPWASMWRASTARSGRRACSISWPRCIGPSRRCACRPCPTPASPSGRASA